MPSSSNANADGPPRFAAMRLADVDAVARIEAASFPAPWNRGHFHAANPQGQHGHHEYRASDYGLEEEAMARAFAPYSEHFGVPVERGR